MNNKTIGNDGENRAVDAATKAISNPMLEDSHIDGAKNILINICASDEVSMQEVNDICKIVSASAAQDFNMYWGQVTSPLMGDKISVTVIATGFDNAQKVAAPEPEEKVSEVKTVIDDPNVLKPNELENILHPGAKTVDPLSERNSEPFTFENNPDKSEENKTPWGNDLFNSTPQPEKPVRRVANIPSGEIDPDDINQPAIWTQKYSRGINLSD